jgi:hypothetical protein
MYLIRLPWGTTLLTSNSRADHTERSRITRDIRATAYREARKLDIPRMNKVHVRGIYHYPDNRRRDPGNWHLSVKAMVDGALVDTGIIPDDCDEYLIDDGIIRGYPNIKGGQLVLDVTPDIRTLFPRKPGDMVKPIWLA